MNFVILYQELLDPQLHVIRVKWVYYYRWSMTWKWEIEDNAFELSHLSFLSLPVPYPRGLSYSITQTLHTIINKVVKVYSRLSKSNLQINRMVLHGTAPSKYLHIPEQDKPCFGQWRVLRIKNHPHLTIPYTSFHAWCIMLLLSGRGNCWVLHLSAG